MKSLKECLLESQVNETKDTGKSTEGMWSTLNSMQSKDYKKWISAAMKDKDIKTACDRCDSKETKECIKDFVTAWEDSDGTNFDGGGIASSYEEFVDNWDGKNSDKWFDETAKITIDNIALDYEDWAYDLNINLFIDGMRKLLCELFVK